MSAEAVEDVWSRVFTPEDSGHFTKLDITYPRKSFRQRVWNGLKEKLNQNKKKLLWVGGCATALAIFPAYYGTPLERAIIGGLVGIFLAAQNGSHDPEENIQDKKNRQYVFEVHNGYLTADRKRSVRMDNLSEIPYDVAWRKGLKEGLAYGIGFTALLEITLPIAFRIRNEIIDQNIPIMLLAIGVAAGGMALWSAAVDEGKKEAAAVYQARLLPTS